MLREVEIQEIVAGRLFFSAMPGRDGDLRNDFREMESAGIGTVVCLAGMPEIKEKSPEYWKRLIDENVPWRMRIYPIDDFGAPECSADFVALIDGIARGLQKGENVLIHCGAGIGRTGTVANCVLLNLGLEPEEASERVLMAGAHPETQEQKSLIAVFRGRSQKGRP